MTTIDQARAAKTKLTKSLLLDNFNDASRPPVNMIGLGGNANDGYYVKIGLERTPTKEEAAQLPHECDGVEVKYEIAGPIRAL